MASEEAKFVARAERLAGFGGVASAQRFTNRYVLPQFGEQTPVSYTHLTLPTICSV